LDQRPKQTVVSLFDPPDPLPNLFQVKVIESFPVGLKEFFVGVEVKPLVARPGVVLWHLIQEPEEIEVQRFDIHKFNRTQIFADEHR
jgi:hypothetical protein